MVLHLLKCIIEKSIKLREGRLRKDIPEIVRTKIGPAYSNKFSAQCKIARAGVCRILRRSIQCVGGCLRQAASLEIDRVDSASPRIVDKQGVILGIDGRSGEIHAEPPYWRSEEHTSELQSLMRISYAVLCLKKKQRHH